MIAPKQSFVVGVAQYTNWQPHQKPPGYGRGGDREDQLPEEEEAMSEESEEY